MENLILNYKIQERHKKVNGVKKKKKTEKTNNTTHKNTHKTHNKYLDDISDADIAGLNIPTGVPLVYELDDDLHPITHYYLGDQEAIASKIDAVKNQDKAKK